MQQLCSQRQEPLEQSQFYFLGRPRSRLVARNVLDQFLELTAKLVYNLSRVGRHRLSPSEESWLGYLDYPPESGVFQLIPIVFSQTQIK